jgi:hypothetical protein
MNFSDLPNNSWEKVMVHLVEHIGGGLVNVLMNGVGL